MKRLAYFMTLQLFSFALFALDLITHDEINFIPKPIITFPESISGITWSENNYFALSEKKFVCFSANDEIGEQMIASPGGDIKYIKFVKPNTPPHTEFGDESAADDILIVLTENNVLGMKTFSSKNGNYLLTKVYDHELEISAIDFSPEGNRILLGLATGEVRLMVPTYIENDILEFSLDDHTASVYSVSFSNDGRYFLTASKDGFINIYSRDKETKKLFTVKSESNYELPVCFSPDSRFVVNVKQKRIFLFRDFAGNVIQEIKIERNVKDYSMSADSTYLFVLAENSLIYVFDINTGEKVGYIPPFNKYPVTQFAFNKTESRLIVGHSDGSVYYLKSEEVILEPNAKPPSLGQGFASSGGGGDGFVKTGRSDHSIEIRAEIGKLQTPYTLSVAPMVGYTNGRLINPLFFGVYVKALVGFPNTVDFPYVYTYPTGIYNGITSYSVLPSPYLGGISVSVPLGFAIKPFGSEFEFFGEIQAAASFYTFYFPITANAPSGFIGLFPSFTAGGYVGISYGVITVYAGVLYDLRTGFSINAGAGYRIKVGR